MKHCEPILVILLLIEWTVHFTEVATFWEILLYWCYCPHTSRDLISPVCRIFHYNCLKGRPWCHPLRCVKVWKITICHTGVYPGGPGYSRWGGSHRGGDPLPQAQAQEGQEGRGGEGSYLKVEGNNRGKSESQLDLHNTSTKNKQC